MNQRNNPEIKYLERVQHENDLCYWLSFWKNTCNFMAKTIDLVMSQNQLSHDIHQDLVSACPRRCLKMQ